MALPIKYHKVEFPFPNENLFNIYNSNYFHDIFLVAGGSANCVMYLLTYCSV